MRTAVNYMLLSAVEDKDNTIQVFPTVPTDQWDVAFKLHGPQGTTIEASCKGGKLEYMHVDPPDFSGKVNIFNCEQ